MAFTNSSITFGASGLVGESSNNPTAIDTSKTGQPFVYVAQQDGTVYRYEVDRAVDGFGALTTDFTVVNTLAIGVIPGSTQNYNDGGTSNSTTQRQVTGMTVSADADGNDVLYVSSSDWRIAVGNDTGLDTNSGQVHRIVVASADYAAANAGVEPGDILSNVAIIRGLPRSEENHATNGLDLGIDPVSGDTYLYVAQGGNTNKGAPGNNFSGTVDFALSGTILKFNLTELESFDVRTDGNGEQFVLDLPTLNDPTRTDVDLLDLGLSQAQIDANPNFSLDDNGSGPDWAGGNNGLNMAKITERVLVSQGGELVFVDNPMTVFAPGFRNQYDVLVTEAGDVFTWDNGPNGGWGGQPLSFSDGQIVDDWTSEFATNEFNEGGSDGFGDQLHYVGGIGDAYGTYGGDANPIRASKEALAAAFNPDGTYKGATPSDPIVVNGAQIFTDETQARTYLANILIIYEEQGSGVWNDVTGTTGLPADLFDVVSGYDWFHPGSSLNDPTAFFDGLSVMDGTAYSPESQLLDNNNDGSLKTVNASTNGLAEYTASFFGGALDGAVIAASFNGNLYFEKPIDTDGDGRVDAVDSLGTIGGFGSQPLSVTTLGDAGFSPDVLIDKDGDGIDDFAGLVIAATYGADNVTFFVPGGQPADPSTDLDLDGLNNIVDSHVGDPTEGLGVRVGADETQLWDFELNNPATTPAGAVPDGNSIAGDIGVNAVWRNGVDPQVAEPGEPALYNGGVWNLGGASTIVSIDAANTGSAEGTANDQGDVLGLGFAVEQNVGAVSIVTTGKNIFSYSLNENKTWDGGEKYGLVVGPGDQSTFVQAAVAVVNDGGSVRYGIELLVEEDDQNSSVFLEIPGIEAPVRLGDGDPDMQVALDLDLTPGASTATARARYVDNGVFTDWAETTAIAIPADVAAAVRGTYQNAGKTTGAFVGLLSTAAAGDDSFGADWDSVEITGAPLSYAEGEVLYRWNAGNVDIAAIDGGPAWLQSTATLVGSSAPSTQNAANNGLDGSVDPATTPTGLYTNELYGNDDANPFGLEFGNGTLADGLYAVRLFMGNGFDGTSAPGARVFDVSVEGALFLDDLDLSATLGHKVGGMFEWVGVVDDGTVDIDFAHVVENPLINAVEIVALDPVGTGPALSILSAAALEGDAGSGDVLVTVQTSRTVPVDETVAFTYAVRPVAGGATPAVDYTVPGGTFDPGTGVYTGSGSIAGGSADFTIPVAILGDTDIEGNEAFEIEITSVSGADAYIGTGTATVTILDDDGALPGEVLYRVNAGGAEVAASDGGPAWSEDQSAANANGTAATGTPSPYLDLTAPSEDVTFGSAFTGTNGTDAPDAVFGTERYSTLANPDNMSWAFDVVNGDYIVNLYFAEIWTGAQDPGERVFDVNVEGALALDDFDITGAFGWNTAGVQQVATTVSDGTLNVDFLQGVQNPKLSAIEIVSADPAPDSTVSIGAPSPASVVEDGDTGTTTLVFPVTFDVTPNGYVEVGYEIDVNGAISTGTLALGVTDGQIVVDVPNDDQANGPETVTVKLTGIVSGDTFAGIGNATATGTVTEDDNAGGEIVAAINAGGPALTQDGIDFSADQYFDGGQAFTDGAGGNGEQPAFDGTIYETERYGGGTAPAFSYAIPVAPGSYSIELYFAEIYQTDPGQRVFDVIVEGQIVLDDYDILAENGGDINAPVVLTLPDTVSPDSFGDPAALDISVTASVDNAKVSGIVVRTADGTPTVGAATLTVNDGATNIEQSNFGNGSFQIQNVGDKAIAWIELDVTDAILPDAVFDPFGLAGDDVGKIVTLNGGTDGGTGLIVPSGGFGAGAEGITYLGTGGIAGFERLRLEFDDFTPGKSISFGVDMDPNSIAGSDKGTLDSGASLAGAGLWDVGGIGGAELSGSTFTVGYTDGSTSTGQLQGQGADAQMGAEALSTQAAGALDVTLTANGLGAGDVGTYTDGGPQILIQGPAGETARVLVGKGFIVPFTNEFADSDPYKAQLDAQLAALEDSGFAANNMVEMLYVDVALDGTVQDISSLFDFTQVAAFDLSVPDAVNEYGVLDEAQLPLGITASVIDTATDQPKGPVTSPIHLSYSEVQEADLSLSKTVSDPTPVAGDTVTFTLTLDNDGPAAATGVVVEETLPAGFAFVGAAGDGNFDPATGVWTVGTVGTGGSASLDLEVTVLDLATLDEVTPIYRVNVGGATVAAADGSALDWSGDQGTFGDAANSPYLVANSTGTSLYTGDSSSAHPGAIDLSDPSVPASAPLAVFNTERYDAGTDPEMAWQFDVAAGTLVEVKLLFAELFSGIDAVGERVFDVNIEGGLAFDDVDPYAIAGPKGAFALTERVVVGDDGTLDIEFLHGVENPALKGIEISTVVEGDATAYDTFAEVIASDLPDPDSTPDNGPSGEDDEATVSVAPLTTADLELAMTVSDEAPAYGDTVTYTLTLTHAAGVDATGVAVQDLLPNGVTYVGDSGGGAYDPATGLWSVGSLARGATATLDITATVNGPIVPQVETVLYRVNAGGAELAATDGGPAWSADTAATNSPYLAVPGSNNVSSFVAVDPGATVPGSVPGAIFDTERWDAATDPEMAWAFDVGSPGTYGVRLFMGNGFTGTSDVGARVFDVAVEGTVLPELDNIDLSAQFGHEVGGMIEVQVEVTDGTLDLTFLHDLVDGMENPLLNGIEIYSIEDGAPVPADYANYAQILTADQEDPDSVPGDASVGDDDDATVVLDASATGSNVATVVAVSDAAEPGTDGQFAVQLEAAVTEATTIAYAIGGSATNGADYAALGGTVVVAAGADSAIIDISVIDDTVFEGDETVEITLTGVSAGDANVIIDPDAKAAILLGDDDPEELVGGQLGVQITPGTGLDASTFGSGSFILTNESLAGSGIQVAQVSFDLSTALLPDMVFDPTGAGGDATASPFTPNSGAAATGLVQPADPSSDPFSQARNGGFDVLTIDFTDFDPGEQFTFTTDIDPNSIQGVPGAGNAGSVSGYELIGSTVTVTFTDGTTQEVSLGSLVHEGAATAAAGDGGSLGGSLARIRTDDTAPAPTLALVAGGADLVATLPGVQADVNSTDFLVEVTGPANSTVDILQMDSRLFIASGAPAFGVSPAELPFYANEAMAGQVVATVQLDAAGTAQVPFSLLTSDGGTGPDGGVNGFVAVVQDAAGSGAIGLTSAPLVVKLGAPLVYDAPGVMTFDGTNAGVQELPHDPAWQVAQGTVAFSFTASDTSGAQGLFGKDASFFGGGGHTTIYLNGSTLIARFQDDSSSAELSFGGISAGEEYEIAATFGPDGVALWVDGNLVDSDDLAVSWAGNEEYVQWGGRGWGSSTGAPGFDAPFQGTISDKQIYAQVLTASQIAGLASSSSGSNNAPVPGDDTILVDEDGKVNFAPLTNDTDPDGDALVVAGIATAPGKGEAVIEADGTVTYTPNPDANGSDSFELLISDGVDTVTSTVFVEITPVDDDPVAVDDTGTTVTGNAVNIDVIANDIELDGDALVVTGVSGGAAGSTVTINGDGTVTYTPASGFVGEDKFTYTVSDAGGVVTSTATVTITVLDEPNVPPVAVADAITVDEDGSVTFQPGANDTDANGDTVTAFAIAVSPANGSASVGADGSVTYTPDADFNGDDSFEVQVTDGNGGFDTATVSVTVTPVNDAPVAVDDSATVQADGAIIIDLLGNDVDIDGDVLTLAGLTATANGGTIVDNGNGTVTYTPAAGQTEDSFDYTVTDGEFSDTATVSIDITSFPTPVVDLPNAVSFDGSSGSVIEQPHDALYSVPQATLNFSFTAADTSGAQGLFSKDASGFGGGGNHLVIYLNGSTLVARYQDGGASATFQVPGIVAGQTYDVAAVFGAGGASELYIDGELVATSPLQMDWTQNIEWIQWGGRGWGSSSGSSGFDAPFEGTISDRQFYDTRLDAGQVAELHADGPLNTPPVAVDDIVSVDEDSSVTFDAAANDTDLDGDTVTIDSIGSGPANGSATIEADGQVTYTPDADFFGTDTFELVVSDGNGGTDTSEVTVTVNGLEDDPEAVNDVAETVTDAPVIIDVLANDSDADGDLLMVTGTTAPVSGSVAVNGDGTVTYTPDAGFVGTDTFDYTLSDGDGPTATATVTVEVSEPSSLPTPVFEVGGVTGFNGSSGSVINVAPTPDLEIAEGTIAFSFIDDNPSARQGLVVKDASGFAGGGNHFAAYIESGDLKVRFQDGANSETFVFDITANQEYEVAAVFDGDGVELWIDGVLADSAPGFVMDWTGNGEYLQVGGLGWGSATGGSNFTNPFSGQMADVAIFDAALEEEQIGLLAADSSFDI
ncbi:Ig-like domain-containing protein [Roseivivax marinus]|uniref:Ig-like domain-containing protein n=1 Tax=Roseivivax marinus TaxID=1379903 RepID=UPI001F040323|nr:Ig-like domain-containing protein [Roseivivax marinus]UMA66195.1 Ig-like domain-containing protein [Roseivivax marinus]